MSTQHDIHMAVNVHYEPDGRLWFEIPVRLIAERVAAAEDAGIGVNDISLHLHLPEGMRYEGMRLEITAHRPFALFGHSA